MVLLKMIVKFRNIVCTPKNTKHPTKTPVALISGYLAMRKIRVKHEQEKIETTFYI